MADGALTFTITGGTVAKLEERARALGLAPDEVVSDLIGRTMDDGAGLHRVATSLEDYEGPFVELEDALAEFSAELERRLASRNR